MLFHRPTHRAVATALCSAVSAATATTGIAAADPTPTPAGAGCAPVTAILVPGTWETSPVADASQPVGMLAPIGTGLRQRYDSSIEVRTLAYTAGATPYDTSESQGVQALSATLSGLCASTRVVLAGYSQGADIAGDLATAIGQKHGPIPADRVVAVGLLSDPRRDPATTQLGAASPGEGIAGPRRQDFGDLTDRVRTLCATGDLYCATSPQASPALAAIGRAVTGNLTPTTAPSATGTTPAPSTPPAPTTTLSGPAAATAPATAVPTVLQELNPSEVVGQVVGVLSGLVGFAANLPAIGGDLAQLPALVGTGDLPGLHRVTADLNTQFAPLVQMAARLDLHLVARALALAAPLDTSGWVGVAAQIVAILAGLDVARIATDIGQAQEVSWNAVEKLAGGDLVAALGALSPAVSVVTDLLAVAADALTGNAASSLTGLANTFTATTSPATGTALADLVRQGSDAATFAASGVHQDGYATATTTLLDWLEHEIDNAK